MSKGQGQIDFSIHGSFNRDILAWTYCHPTITTWNHNWHYLLSWCLIL